MTPSELNEARHFYLVAPVVDPILAKKKELVLTGLINRHREGRTDFATLVAELVVISDLEREIRTKGQIYAAMEAGNGNNRNE